MRDVQPVTTTLIIIGTAFSLILCSAAIVMELEIFECHGDKCNFYGIPQFCSSEFEYCRDCKEILDDCLTTRMPKNCSGTCIDFLSEQKLEKERVKPCESIPTIEHGYHNGTNQSTPGDVIVYECNPGYRLEGAQLVRCKDVGVWSSEFPQCKEIVCKALQEVSNGFHNGSTLNSHKPGDQVNTYCLPGFTFLDHITTMCGKDGQWSHEMPFCKEITCTPPPQIASGKWDIATNSAYPLGTIATLGCFSDFFIDGQDKINCTERGWIRLGKTKTFTVCNKTVKPCSYTVYVVVSSIVTLVISITIIFVWHHRPVTRILRTDRREQGKMGGTKQKRYRNKRILDNNNDKQHLLHKYDADNEPEKEITDIPLREKKQQRVSFESTISLEEKKDKRHKSEPNLYMPNSRRRCKSEGDDKFVLNITLNNDVKQITNGGFINIDETSASQDNIQEIPKEMPDNATCKVTKQLNDKFPQEETATSPQAQPEAVVYHPTSPV